MTEQAPETVVEQRKRLIDTIISMYHTTRLRETGAADHVLSKDIVKREFAAYEALTRKSPETPRSGEVASPKVHHLGAALQGIADEHAEVLTPRQIKALYDAANQLWDTPKQSPEIGAGTADREAVALVEAAAKACRDQRTDNPKIAVMHGMDYNAACDDCEHAILSLLANRPAPTTASDGRVAALEEAAKVAEQAVIGLPSVSLTSSDEWVRTVGPTWNNAARKIAAAIRALASSAEGGK